MKAVLVLSMFFIAVSCFADESWERVSGLNETNLEHIAIDAYSVYAASVKVLYRSQGGNKPWTAVFSVEGADNAINFVAISEGGVFVCAKNGVFTSNDGQSGWRSIFKGIGDKENNVLHIAFLKEKKIYLATDNGLFISNDNGFTWSKDNLEGSGFNVKWIDFLDGVMLVATVKGVYKNSGNGWKRTFITTREDVEYDTNIADEALAAIKPVNSIAVDKGVIFLATDSGIFVSRDKGETWNSFINSGLVSMAVKRILCGDSLYAVTDKGVFIFSDKSNLWQALYKGMPTKQANSITKDSEGNIWAVTKKGLYRYKQDNPSNAALNSVFEDEKQDILKRFEDEPCIKDVQAAAIKYAEVHPDKIKEWREAARKKALLPNVSLGMDRNITDLYHWEGGSTAIVNDDYLRRGKSALEWDISLTWDMGDLIWNSDQTSIDTRSKLMVELRDDIMNEVTRTYFERRRLQAELLVSPPQDLKAGLEKELRLQELTADIDALTGGYFSKQLEK